MQKKDRNQRRHLPGWCGPGRWSWWAPWGPGLQCPSPQHRFPPISLDLPMFLSWTESGFSPGFPCQYSIGVITYLKTISSWWRHQNFPTRLLKHGNGNADDPRRWIQAFISISGFINWLAIPPVLHELTWLVTSSRQRLTRNTEQEDVTTLWVRHWWRHTSMTGSGGFTPGSPVSTHKDFKQKRWFCCGYSAFHPPKNKDRKSVV